MAYLVQLLPWCTGTSAVTSPKAPGLLCVTSSYSGRTANSATCGTPMSDLSIEYYSLMRIRYFSSFLAGLEQMAILACDSFLVPTIRRSHPHVTIIYSFALCPRLDLVSYLGRNRSTYLASPGPSEPHSNNCIGQQGLVIAELRRKKNQRLDKDVYGNESTPGKFTT